MKATRCFLSGLYLAAAIFFFGASVARPQAAQSPAQKPAEKSPEKIQEKIQDKSAAKSAPKIPAEIELLETRIRFETDGSSRKEVHARVKINDELGARQFARLNFDFNRAFEQIEIPLVRITHPSGGTADVLPSAITDTPNPAVVNAPAYQDVRVKSVRILGLEPGDTLEYRVITTVSHHPLAPDFWLDHSFDRTGVVFQEIFELDLPASRNPGIRINPATPATSTDKSGEGDASRTIYRWKITAKDLPTKSENPSADNEQSVSDVSVSTEAWEPLSIRLDEKLTPGAKPMVSAQFLRRINARTFAQIPYRTRGRSQSIRIDERSSIQPGKAPNRIRFCIAENQDHRSPARRDGICRQASKRNFGFRLRHSRGQVRLVFCVGVRTEI